MGRFSKLEPNQPPAGVNPEQGPAAPGPAAARGSGRALPPAGGPGGKMPPTLATRLEPGALGAAPAENDLNRTPTEWLDLGDDAFLRGETRAALRWYSRALDKDTTLAEAWVAMIRVLLFREEFGQAETWNVRALSLFPNNGPLLAMRAVVQARRGMLRQALGGTEGVMVEHGANPLAQIARGEVLLLADNKNADFCFNQALTMVPKNDWKTPATIAMIYEKERNWARAIQFYGQAAERNDGNPVLWFRIAGCRRELGQSGQARLALEHARQLCTAGDPLLLQIEHAKTGSFLRRITRLFWK